MCRGVPGRALCWLGPFLRVSWFWRSVPSPPALFCPFAHRVCPLFSFSCLSGFTRLRPGVCVCDIWTDVKILLHPFLYILRGAVAHSWDHCQRSYSWVGRISALIIPTYLLNFSICDWHGKGLSREPQHSFSRDSVPNGSLKWSSSCLV